MGTSGQIYHFNFGTKTFTQVTGSLRQIVVGEGKVETESCHPYEVWGIDASDNIFRYNYCTPKKFEQIPGSLSVIATGGGSVWELNSSAQIYYHYIPFQEFVQVQGSLNKSQLAGMMFGAWTAPALSTGTIPTSEGSLFIANPRLPKSQQVAMASGQSTDLPWC